MKKVLFFLMVLAVFLIGRSDAAAADRQDVIAKNLDCFQRLYEEGAISQKDICALDTAAPEGRKSSVKVKVDPIVVRSGDEAAEPDPDEMLTPSSEEPVSAAMPAKLPEDGFSYQYFNFKENSLNSAELGAEIFDYTYREEGFMKLDGSMVGVYGVYTHRFHENDPVNSLGEIFSGVERLNVLRLDSRYSRGSDIKYRSEGSGEKEDETHFAHETRVVVGADYPISGKDVTLTPYAGLGYRYLKDDNGGQQTTTGHWSYDRESKYVYIPLGIDIARTFERGWKTVVNLEYDIFVDGTQESHLGDVPGYSETLSNDQNKGYGYRGSIKVIKETPSVNFVVEPFTRYWHIKDSDAGCTVDLCGLEPNNRTWEFGLKTGIQF